MPVTFNKEYYCTYRAGIPGGILRLSVTEDNSEWKYVISCIGIRPTGEEITKTESIPIKANNDELEFYKYGEKHFISYRNYSVSNRLGDEYFDKMESEGLAESDRGKQSVTYYLTEKGFQWLEKVCDIVIHAKNRPEKKYPLNKDDEEQIIEIWAWLKKKEIYTSEFPEELDVAIWLDTDAMESFFEYFGNEENPVPARIYQNAILVLFSDVLDFKVTGMQIWSFRPHGMREEW